ncbi:reverse transcriptase domain-containing protein [Tanacetum coccineum]
MTFEHLTKEVLVEVLLMQSIEEKEILQDPKESRRLRVKAPQYMLIRGNLYQRSIYTPWLCCVASPQTDNMEQSAIRKVAESSVITAGSGWPFSHWGVNILGPLPTAAGGFKFLAIAVEHSTKWMEAKPLTVINERHAKRFVWEYVVCKFEVPRIISSKDEKHFLEGWVDDLAQVLWVHRTLLRNSQKETPFSLTYGSEAIIPISENNVAKYDRGKIKEVDKRRGSKEIASIEEAYYGSKLHI